VATFLAAPPLAPEPTTDPGVAAHEPAQPVHTRYWLHNSGPAPRGNMPVSLYLSPTALTATGPVTTTVRVGSELTDTSANGTVVFDVPPGWFAEPAELPYALAPGGFTLAEVRVTPPPDAEPGRHWLTARLSYGGQTYEDVVGLDVPGGPPPGRGLVCDLVADRVTVRRGERAQVPVSLRNTTRGPVGGQLWAVSSWGTWPGVEPGLQGFTVPGGEQREFVIEVDGSSIPPGAYWLMAKAAWNGQVAYTKAIALEVTP
jgi:alpha-galactosidase-like protein